MVRWAKGLIENFDYFYYFHEFLMVSSAKGFITILSFRLTRCIILPNLTRFKSTQSFNNFYYFREKKIVRIAVELRDDDACQPWEESVYERPPGPA